MEIQATPLDELYGQTQSSPEGLTGEQRQLRLEQNGANALIEGKKKSWLVKFLSQFKDVMIIVLLVAAAVSAAVCFVQREYAELIDSGIILLIVIINAVIGLVQENKAESAMEALKNMNKQFCKVLCDGKVVQVPSENLVTGDIVQLDAGDIVAADLRLISSASLKIEEAALTGESVPVEKHADATVKEGSPLGDRLNMAYSSGIVTYGRGRGLVVATGMNTEVGKIATMLNTEGNQNSPLQNQLAKTAKILSILVLAIAAVIFGVNLIRHGGENLLESFMTAVAIAVAAIPEGLPAVVTIVLALGMQKMGKCNAIVKNLSSVETLGCCEIICSDKTGTLTLNKMTVKELYAQSEATAAEKALTEAKYDLLARTLALCNDTEQNGNNLVGDPTETALVQYYVDRGGNFARLCESWRRVDETPFDSIRKLMSTVNEPQSATDGKKTVYVKGAPDLLIARCSKIDTAQGVRDITPDDVKNITAANKQMASKALRVLAAAVKYDSFDHDGLENELVFVGLVGMIDPPRPEVKRAVEVCRLAGMRPLMITGDHVETAAAIAREIGILREGEEVMSGVEIDGYTDEEFAKIITKYSVFARVSPENKVKIVKAYRSLGKIVAMTGDGVNDAPSIKSADIGIGMGITGTDVSKGAADMVLADDNFATIVRSVEEGRKIYSNIKKAVQFLLSANIAEVMCLFIVSIFMNAPFLTPVMILWINLVTDSFPALSLGVEDAERDVMLQKPRRSNTSLFAGKTGFNIMLQGAMQTMLVLGAYLLGKYAFGGGEITMSFVSLCLIQLFHAYNLRNQDSTIFTSKLFKNKYMNLSFIVGVLLVALVVIVPPLQTVFSTTSLSAAQWAASVGMAAAIIPLVELQKLIERAIDKRSKRSE